jgi:hypothetical protein
MEAILYRSKPENPDQCGQLTQSRRHRDALERPGSTARRIGVAGASQKQDSTLTISVGKL